MKPTIEWLHPATLALLCLAALALLVSPGDRRAQRMVAPLLLLVGTIALLAALAVPSLLPPGSAFVHPSGSNDDPRVLNVLLAGLAGLAALVHTWRVLRLPLLGNVGAAIPGIATAGLFAAVAYFAGLHLPLGLLGIALGGFVSATAISLAFRASGHPGTAATMVFALGIGVFVVAGALSLHGARVGSVAIAEGAAVDTLGQRLIFARVDAPSANLRVLQVVLYRQPDSLRLSPELRGATGSDVRSVADASWLSGPSVVPLELEERQSRKHEMQWLDRTAPLRAGNASIALAGFRFVKGDTIRMYTDLEVTTPAGKQTVSPGVFATPRGEIPFAAQAKGFGPIAVAKIDADHGRVGLVLPQLAGAGVSRIAVFDLRLRPALQFAWGGAALALVGFLLALVPAGPDRRKP